MTTTCCRTRGRAGVGLEDWFNGTDQLCSVQRADPHVRRRIERRSAEARAEPNAAPPLGAVPVPLLSPHQLTQPPALVVLVTRLGELDDDLRRVGDSLAGSAAAFSRVVHRWHPLAVPWWKSNVAPRLPKRPADKVRRGSIPAVFDRETTQSAGMQRRSNAVKPSSRAARDRPCKTPRELVDFEDEIACPALVHLLASVFVNMASAPAGALSS